MLKTVFIMVLSLFLLPFASAATLSPLPVDKAFAFSAHIDQGSHLILEWHIAPGYYLYRNRLILTPTDPARIGKVTWPQGVSKWDALHGDYQVYVGLLSVPVALIASKKGIFSLDIHYQGCSSAGFCYTPIKKQLRVDLSRMTVRQDPNQTGPSVAEAIKSPVTDDYILHFFEGRYWLAIISGFLGLGLLLAFTPCVLPMIPILSGIILGQNRKTNKKKSFFLSLAYVIGMAMTYAIAGMAVALIGGSIQQALQKPWIIIVFSGLFVLLGLSLLGLYELRLPPRFQRQVSELSNKQSAGTYLGVFLMGCLSTLIVSPCVSAPLVGVLTYIGQTGDVLLGAVALLALGIGMGIPLLIIGMSADKILPKAGSWMIVIERLFGIIMLGLAVWMLSRVIPAPEIFVRQQLHSSSIFRVIHSMDELNEQLAQAKKNHQPALLDFYADWCTSCVLMDRTVFSRNDVRYALRNRVVLRADLTKNNAFDQAVQKRFHVIGPPTIIFFNRQGQALTSSQIVGEVNAEEFLAQLTTF